MIQLMRIVVAKEENGNAVYFASTSLLLAIHLF